MNVKMMLSAAAVLAGVAASAEDLAVTSANSPYVIDSAQTYDAVVVSGGGELVVTNRATLSAGSLTVGKDGTKGTLTVTDGSTVAVTEAGDAKESAPFKIAYGTNSEGVLNLLDGSTLTATHALVSYNSGAKSAVTISNSLFRVSNTLYNTRNASSNNKTNSVFVLREGGVLDFNGFYRNSPKSFTLVQFDGGSCTNRNVCDSLDGGWLVFEGVNGHPVDYAAIGSDAYGYFTLDGNTPSYGTAHVHLTGNGGVRLYSNASRKTVNVWGTVPTPDGLTSDYTGDLVILAKRLTQTAPNQMFSKRNRIVLKGTNRMTSVLDLNGFDAECAAIVEVENCYVLNPGNRTNVTLTVGADNGNSALKTLLCQSPVTVRKVGTGSLDLYSDNGSDHAPALTVEKGTVNLYSRAESGYKIYKWMINDTYGKNPKQIYVRISEVELFDANGAKVDLSNAGGEYSSLLKDGKPAKDGDTAADLFFVKTNFVNNTPYFTFSFATPTPVASYRWATGCDYGTETKWAGRTDPGYNVDLVPPHYDVTMCRDPSDWTVYGSNDNYVWVEIGKVKGFKAPNNRWSWTSSFALDYAAPLTDGKIKVFPGATINVKSGKRINVSAVENDGTINYVAGSTVVLTGAVQALNLLDSGTGSAAIEKTGEGEASVLGTRPAMDSVKVSAGSLRLGGNGGVTQKYWRWRIKDTRNWWYDPEKWSPYNVFPGAAYTPNIVAAGELALYDAEGNRVNLISQGTTVVKADVEGKSDFSSLLDGNLGTWLSLFFEDSGTSETYINVPRILPDDPTTWKGFVFKLPDGAKPVYSYDISTPWDHTDRDPAAWDFAVSDDGENWTVIEDHAEDKTEFLSRLGEPHRNQFGMFNCGLPMRFRQSLSATDTTCYEADAAISVGAGASLVLPGTTTVTGKIRVDATQAEAGTVNVLNFAADGVLEVENFTKFTGGTRTLPFRVGEAVNAENFASWQLLLNGLPSSKYLLSLADGYLTLGKTGLIFLLK